MKRSKFSETQIISILNQWNGRTAREVCREHEISENTYVALYQDVNSYDLLVNGSTLPESR